jgi:V/A-type H+-transporting ATPase subunit I
MILPMKKIYLITQDKYRLNAMKTLRQLGVMHVEKTNPSSAGIDKAIERMSHVEEAMTLIQAFKEPKKKAGPVETTGPWMRKPTASGKRGRRSSDQYSEEDEPYSLEAVNAPVRPSLVNLMLEINAERKTIE